MVEWLRGTLGESREAREGREEVSVGSSVEPGREGGGGIPRGSEWFHVWSEWVPGL